MKISKLYFKNVYGITQAELEPGDVTIFKGPNECGKTSFLHSIMTIFSNKGMRTRIIKNGEKEAELQIELDDGTVIDRKKRLEASDFIKVSNGRDVMNSPESFLKNLFSGEQFNPVRDFCEKTPREQKKVLLSLCSINYGPDDFTRDFGELPQNYEDGRHVLENLEAIQSINGFYYKTREDTNRERRANENIRDDILLTMPKDYSVEDWRLFDLSAEYGKVSTATAHNAKIAAATTEVETLTERLAGISMEFDNKILRMKAGYDLKKQNVADENVKIQQQIAELQAKIDRNIEIAAQCDIASKSDEKTLLDNRDSLIEETLRKKKELQSFVDANITIDVEPIKAAADEAERMKSFVRDADKVNDINEVILALKNKADELTRKIELARALPSQLLQTAIMPVSGISIQNGEILVDNLPIDNLSDGRQMEIALEIAKAKAGDLKVVLLDGFERLDPNRQSSFLLKAKESGLQFFITSVAGGDGLQIIEM